MTMNKSGRSKNGCRLEEEETRYRFLTEHMKDLLWTTDLEMRTTYVSPSIEKVLGITPAERLCQPLEEQMPSGALQRFRKKLEEELARDGERDPGRSVTLDLEYYHRDGSIRILESRLSFIRDQRGNPAGIYGLSRDVTKRQRVEEFQQASREILEILNSEGEFPELLERILDILKLVTGCDAAGIRLQSGNDFPYFTQDGFSRDFLLTENSLLSSDPDGGICRNPDGTVSLECACGLVISGKTDPANPLFTSGGSCWTNDSFSRLELPESEDPRHRPRNRCIHSGYASIALVPIRARTRIVGLLQFNGRAKDLFTLEDIRVLEEIASHVGEALLRVQVEDELRRSEARFRNILASAPLAIQGYRIDGTVIYWNRESERVYGYASGEVLGKNLGDLIIPKKIRPFFEESLRNCAGLEASGEFMPAGEVILRRKDGSAVLVHSIHTAVCVAGSEPMLFCIDLDLSERKRAEEERLEMERRLQQTQKLESLGVLSGGIAHDFNNSLMVILGNAELALREMGRLAPARRSVAEISAAARQASELCKQMLTYAGRAAFSWEPLDLRELIEEMSHLIQVSISPGVVLKYELDPGRIQGDPSQLRQVVLNLIVNASEAIGEGSGVVAISTGTASLDEEELRLLDPDGDLKAGEYVRLQVSDNGRGMAETTRRRVFEPFFTTKFTGRGLGLAAVLGIVRGHQGTIAVTSAPELGTTFLVFFPARPVGEEMPSGPAGKAQVSGWSGAGTVLVADDEEGVRNLAVRILKDLGMKVFAADDGREAVEIYRERGGEIDLAVLDLTMPHLDGVGAMEEIRKLDPEARVILSSGYGEEELERRFRERGVSTILQKPYNLDSFAAAVRLALRKEPPAGKSAGIPAAEINTPPPAGSPPRG